MSDLVTLLGSDDPDDGRKAIAIMRAALAQARIDPPTDPDGRRAVLLIERTIFRLQARADAVQAASVNGQPLVEMLAPHTTLAQAARLAGQLSKLDRKETGAKVGREASKARRADNARDLLTRVDMFLAPVHAKNPSLGRDCLLKQALEYAEALKKQAKAAEDGHRLARIEKDAKLLTAARVRAWLEAGRN